MTINTAEKVETIVLSYLQHGVTSGTFGDLVEIDAAPGLGLAQCYRVTADGLTFIVRCAADGWRVSFGPVTGCDPDLYCAAKLALDSRQGRDVGTVAQALGWTN